MATPCSSYLNVTNSSGLTPASITWPYSLYVMVEMQSASRFKSGSTLKPCFRTVTPSAPPSVGMPTWLIQLRNGYSLPKNQTPMVLPRKSSTLVIPVSFQHVNIKPDLLNGCAMFTTGRPFSRADKAEGIQFSIASAPPPARTWGGAISGPPANIVTSRPSAS